MTDTRIESIRARCVAIKRKHLNLIGETDELYETFYNDIPYVLDLCETQNGISDLAQDLIVANAEVVMLRKEVSERDDYIAGCENIIEKFKGLVNTINNKAVDFHELGPFDEQEALRRVMEICDISLLPEPPVQTEYNRIQAEALNWPTWKKRTYNANFATSAHAKPLPEPPKAPEGVE